MGYLLCHVQKILFCSSSSHPLTLKILLLLSRNAPQALGEKGGDTDVTVRAKHPGVIGSLHFDLGVSILTTVHCKKCFHDG